MNWVNLIVMSGRALVYLIYKGSYERGEGGSARYTESMSAYRDGVVLWSKDLSRTIDYLETRRDIQSDKLAFLGTSFGAAMGAVLPALESRLRVNVLVSGGIAAPVVPAEVDQINFAPRITQPTLMLNGRYDFTFIEPSQRQLFRLLGAPPEHKLHVHYNTGHGVPRAQRSKEILAWLDKYLGPVKK